MKFTGKLKGNFIAITDKSGHIKANTSFQFKITELRNIIIVSAKVIDDINYNQLMELSIDIKNEDNIVQKIDRKIDLPFNEGMQTVNGINPLRLINFKLESTKKISKGYYFKWLEGIRIFDSLLALAWNIFIFYPITFRSKTQIYWQCFR